LPISEVVNKNLEQIALRTICTQSKASSLLLARLNPSYFAWSPTVEAYQTFINVFQQQGRPLLWGEILNIPIITQETRTLLAGFRGRPINEHQVIGLSNALDYWRRLRKFWDINKSINSAFQGDSINPDKLGEHLANLISEARSSGIKQHMFTHMGVGSNIKSVVEQIFTGETETYIPTGFKSFDNFNIGLPRGELFYASAPSSHLKTLVLWQLAMNMAMYGAKVVYVPLEMNERQMTRRHLANISHIPLINFLNAKKLNTQQKQFVWNQLAAFEQRLRTVGTRLSIFTPDGGVELDECLNILTPHKYDVAIFDYISLFKDANDERDMWRQLGKMAWRTKIWADNNNALACLGAQLNESDLTVRYARAINEHCVAGDQYLNIDSKLIKAEELINPNIGAKISSATGTRDIIKQYVFNKKKVLRFETTRGYTLAVSADTPVAVLTSTYEMSWKKAKDIEYSDYLIMSSEYSWSRKTAAWTWCFDYSLKKPSFGRQRRALPTGIRIRSKDFEAYIQNGDKFISKILPTLKEAILYRKNLEDQLYNGINKDNIITIRYIPQKMTTHLAKLLGYYISEGSIENNCIRFGCNDKAMMQDYIYCWNKVFRDNIKYWINSSNGYLQTSVGSKPICAFMKFMGVGNTSRTKQIPWAIMQGSKKHAADFLSAYLEGDGHAHRYGGFSATTYSEQLSKDLQQLFLKFGVICSRALSNDGLHHLPSRNNYQQGNNWLVYCYGTESKEIFEKNIGFVFKKTKIKKGYLNSSPIPYIISSLERRKIGQNRIIIEDGSKKLLRLLRDLKGNTISDMLLRHKLNKNVLKILHDNFPKLWRTTSTILKYNLIFEKIKQVISSIETVYDTTVSTEINGIILDEGHFLSNGFVVHNSSNAWRWVYDRQARETNIITIEQPKSRMQSPRPFELKVEPEYMRVRDLTPEEQGMSRMQSGKQQPQGKGQPQPRPKQHTNGIDLESEYYTN
jgi:intein/homing endonuclease